MEDEAPLPSVSGLAEVVHPTSINNDSNSESDENLDDDDLDIFDKAEAALYDDWTARDAFLK